MKGFDVLIIGGGAAGMSCALILGSAKEMDFVKDKKRIGIIIHQKASHLQDALFNNVLGLDPGTTGKSILEKGKNQLSTLYPHIEQIEEEKVIEVKPLPNRFEVVTNKSVYQAKEIVLAVGYTNTFFIKGLEQFVEPHQKTKPDKNRIQLKNNDHLVTNGIYVVGTLAGWRSQFAIACGSGASVATDILTNWNRGEHTKVHDKKQ